MKQINRFFHRYIVSALGILLLFFAINLALIAFFFLMISLNGAKDSNFPMEHFSGLIEQKNGTITASPEAKIILSKSDAWAMLLDKEGTVIWESGLPNELPSKYSLSDIARFSRWYLEDYPVKVWDHPAGLLVVGFEPGSLFRYSFSINNKYLRPTFFISLAILIINIFVMVFLSLRNLRKVETAMRPILTGIHGLSQGRLLHLEEKGELAEINMELNHASDCLCQKDTLRAQWIRGISHDIRTPLSMILGYSSELEDDPNLPQSTRKQAEIIRRQGEKLSALVADLNLTTKLEYSMQPIRVRSIHPLELARQVISDFLNNGLLPQYQIDLIPPDEDIVPTINGDNFLLKRMLHNLIQNSIVHNPGGCLITILVKIEHETDCKVCIFCIMDTGCGIKEPYLTLLNQTADLPSSNEETEGVEHGLGLKIVKQIVSVHHGEISFSNTMLHGLKTEIRLPDTT